MKGEGQAAGFEAFLCGSKAAPGLGSAAVSDDHPRSMELTPRFPFPITIQRIKGIMHDHFSRYGDLRCVVHLDQVNNAAVKAIVVFLVSILLVMVK